MRVALALALLLLPVASAAPLTGSVREVNGGALDGTVSLVTGDGVLDLSPGIQAGAGLRLGIEGGEGQRVGYSTRVLPMASYQDVPRPPQHLSLGEGTLTSFTCPTECIVTLLADGDGTVGVEQAAHGRLAQLGKARSFCGPACGSTGADFQRVVPAGALTWSTAGGAASGAPTLRAEGSLLLLLRNATAIHEDAAGRRTLLDARATRENESPGGLAYDQVERYILLRVSVTGIEANGPIDAQLYAPSMDVAVGGTFEASRASGELDFAGNRTAFEAQPLRIDGDLRLAASGSARALAVPAQPDDWRADVEGDASLLRIGDATVTAPRAPATLARGAAAVGVLALLAALLAIAVPHLFPLYSRIEASTVLANPNRAQVHALLRDSPGLSLADLTARSGLARVVVRHHLRMLEAHSLVVARSDGRLRRFYPATEAPTHSGFRARVALEDATRRRLAMELGASGGEATQRLLVERTGLSQRLVSHHLRRLQAEGLVEAQGFPRRYAPTAELLALLQSPAAA